jgi:hypothetical protein
VAPYWSFNVIPEVAINEWGIHVLCCRKGHLLEAGKDDGDDDDNYYYDDD